MADGGNTANFLSHFQWLDIATVMTTEQYYANPDTMNPSEPRVHCFRTMFGHKQPSSLVLGGTDQLYMGLMFPRTKPVSHLMVYGCAQLPPYGRTLQANNYITALQLDRNDIEYSRTTYAGLRGANRILQRVAFRFVRREPV